MFLTRQADGRVGKRMPVSPALSTTAPTSAAEYESLSRQYMNLGQNYLELAQQAAAAVVKPTEMVQVQPTPKAQSSFAGGSMCLCAKCAAGQGQCKNVDPWLNYTAWANYA